MSLITSYELHAKTFSAGVSVVALNVITLEHAEAIVEASEVTGIPIIAQLSENAIRYHGSPYPIARALTALAEHSSASVVLHLDHIMDTELARMALDLGFSSIMWDSSEKDYGDNVNQTAEMVKWGKANSVWIESELGEIGGKGGAHAPGIRTNPAEALRFALDTEVDSLAVAVGSSHAMADKSAALDHELIQEIATLVPVPLVLHGSSGVVDSSLVRATKEGIWKINIGTALNIAATGTTRAVLEDDPTVTDPRKYWGPARASMAKVAGHYLRLLSQPLP